MGALVKRDAYRGKAGKCVPLMEGMVFLLFLFLFSGYIISLTSCQKGGAEHAGASRAAETADEAERTLSIFNRTIGAVVLIGGSLFAIYCVKRSSKTRRRRKTGIRRQVHRG
jgi:hypothetical protein